MPGIRVCAILEAFVFSKTVAISIAQYAARKRKLQRPISPQLLHAIPLALELLLGNGRVETLVSRFGNVLVRLVFVLIALLCRQNPSE